MDVFETVAEEALILAVAGREAVLGDLEGDGAALLRQRLGDG